jgi:hypothetical protein
MKRLFFGLPLLLCIGTLTLFAFETELPDEGQIQSLIKAKVPEHIVFKSAEVKSHKISGRHLYFDCSLTATVGEHLYEDATLEAIPEIAQGKVPENVVPPQVLKKLHGAGEIVDLPVTVQFKKVKEVWESNTLDDHGKIDQMGRPMKDFKYGAVVAGTPTAKKALVDFQRALKEAEKSAKTTAAELREKQANEASAEMSARILESLLADKDKGSTQTSPSTTTVTTPGGTTAIPAAPPASQGDEGDRPNDRRIFRELDKVFYAFPKAKESKLKNVEKRLEQVLQKAVDKEMKDYVARSQEEIMALHDNYQQARNARKIFSQDVLNFLMQSMCDAYIQGYSAAMRGDFRASQSEIMRASKKRDELRSLLMK